MRNRHRWHHHYLSFAAVATIVTTVLSGCAATNQHIAGQSPTRHCAAFYADIDEAITEDGVNDAQYHRFDRYPEFRVSRSLAAEIARSRQQISPYLSSLLQLGLGSWRIELANMSHAKHKVLQRRWGVDRETANVALAECGAATVAALTDSPELLAPTFLQAVRVPSGYQDWQRWVGAYPLAGFIVADKIDAENQKTADKFNGVALYVATAPVLYGPKNNAGQLDGRKFEHGQSKKNQSEKSLIARYAPLVKVDQGSLSQAEYNQIHGLSWQGEVVSANAEPAVYTYWSTAVWQGKTVRQINYVMWFKGRPAQGAVDLLAGHLDGLVWRVTLDQDNSPLFFDTIHNCGCYHQFFPVSDTLVARVQSHKEPTFVPRWLSPSAVAGRRAVLHLEADTHYLHNLSFVAGGLHQAQYDLRSYDELRQLPVDSMARSSKSVFDAAGMVPGTQRLERYILWSFGVPSPGQMRQAGHHATAFIGERYFDDPWLFEAAFGHAEDIPALPRRRGRP